MSKPFPFCINFHGIGNPERPLEANEDKYWISEDSFNQFITLIVDLKNKHALQVTFDDGNLSDYELGLPILQQAKIKAHFFILAGKIDQLGYLSKTQIREIKNAGHEIGLHGMNHVDWTKQNDIELTTEMETARNTLQDIIDEGVNSVAIPFGRYNRTVIRKLKELEYKHIYTSDKGLRLINGIVKPRFSVMTNTRLHDIEHQIIKSNSLFNKVLSEVRYQLKSHR